MKIDLDWDDRQRLVELLAGYRREVANGEISGFPHGQEAELAEVDALLLKIDPE